jgi:threonine dehydrogenase-like Zn-dependent dehydrogenase
LQTAGQTVDGYYRDFVVVDEISVIAVDGLTYRDFVVVDENQAYTLPSSVSDEAAFLIEAVALAERIAQEMDVKVGQHILVLGG